MGGLTRDSILDNITLCWLTGTGASAARWYWEWVEQPAQFADELRAAFRPLRG